MIQCCRDCRFVVDMHVEVGCLNDEMSAPSQRGQKGYVNQRKVQTLELSFLCLHCFHVNSDLGADFVLETVSHMG